MVSAAQVASEEGLSDGKFNGSAVSKQAVGGAIVTELQRSQPRKLPAYSHELPSRPGVHPMHLSRVFYKFTGGRHRRVCAQPAHSRGMRTMVDPVPG